MTMRHALLKKTTPNKKGISKYALITRIDHNNVENEITDKIHEYIVAYMYDGNDGTWGSGNYFGTNLESALKCYNEKIKTEEENIKFAMEQLIGCSNTLIELLNGTIDDKVLDTLSALTDRIYPFDGCVVDGLSGLSAYFSNVLEALDEEEN